MHTAAEAEREWQGYYGGTRLLMATCKRFQDFAACCQLPRHPNSFETIA